ncbi:MAG: HAMP domain-containing histidine kinase [Elusimicrobia bacterium]|nr:HAMP domain-containing histidine kinase [Elusimicrobiota bacterium]
MRLWVRFSLAILGLILLSQAFFTGVYFYMERRSEVTGMYRQAMQSVQLAMSVCHEAMVTGNWDAAQEHFQYFSMSPAVRYADCLDADRSVLAHSDPAKIGSKAPEASGAAEGIWEMSHAIRVPGRGAGLARIGYDAATLEAQMNERLARTLWIMTHVSWITMLLGLLVAVLVARAQIRPIEALAAATREISAGNLDYRLPDDARRDELGALRVKFNEMAERLQELDKVKRRIVESFTHDLKTPLAGIKASIEMMLQRGIGPLTETQKKYMESSLDSAVRLWDYIDSILDAMRLQTGEFPMRIEPTAVSEIVNPVVAGQEPKAKECGIRLKALIPKSLSPVKADSELAHRALGNLVANALKFTPAGGSVTIRAEQDGAFVRFEVRDTGAGIPADELDRIFETFYQVGETETLARERGSGLGLAICERIVRGHGGRIWAESELGKGASFFFTLPAVLSNRE